MCKIINPIAEFVKRTEKRFPVVCRKLLSFQSLKIVASLPVMDGFARLSPDLILDSPNFAEVCEVEAILLD